MSGCPHGAEHVGVGDRAPLHGGRRTALGAHCPRRGDARRLDLAVALVPGAVDRRDHRLLHAAGPRRADPARARASCGSAAARGRDAVLGGDTGEPVRHARSAVRSITLSPSSRVRSNATPEAERITTTAGQSSPSAARRAPTSAKSIGRPSASPTPAHPTSSSSRRAQGQGGGAPRVHRAPAPARWGAPAGGDDPLHPQRGLRAARRPARPAAHATGPGVRGQPPGREANTRCSTSTGPRAGPSSTGMALTRPTRRPGTDATRVDGWNQRGGDVSQGQHVPRPCGDELCTDGSGVSGGGCSPPARG